MKQDHKALRGVGTRHTSGREEQRCRLTAVGSRHQKGAMCPVLQSMPGALIKWRWNLLLKGPNCRGWSENGSIKSILWHLPPISGHKLQKQTGQASPSLSYACLKGSQTSRQRLRSGSDPLADSEGSEVKSRRILYWNLEFSHATNAGSV